VGALGAQNAPFSNARLSRRAPAAFRASFALPSANSSAAIPLIVDQKDSFCRCALINNGIQQNSNFEMVMGDRWESDRRAEHE